MRFILSIFLLFYSFSSISAQLISLMTYNIRFDNPDDGINNWKYRKSALTDQILSYQADFIGVQEALWSQMEYLDEQLEDYDFIGVGREDGKREGEFSSIFYKRLEFENLYSNTIWLSESPEEKESGWDAALPRICTYGLFRQRSNMDSIWVLNTHFDHIGWEARKNSAIQLSALVDSLAKETGIPVFLMGDFNALPEEEPILILTGILKDAWEVKEITDSHPNGTFNGFGTSIDDRRIDYIFCTVCEFTNYSLKTKKKADGSFISDHYPVYVKANY